MDNRRFANALNRVVAKGNSPSVNGAFKLQVLTDPEATKLVQRIYGQYVSDADMAPFVQFMIDFDSLLAKYRKGKPITKEEINDIKEEEGISRKEGKKKAVRKPKVAKAQPEPEEESSDDDNSEVVVSDYDEPQMEIGAVVSNRETGQNGILRGIKGPYCIVSLKSGGQVGWFRENVVPV